MQMNGFSAYGRTVPQSEIADIISQGVNPDEITNEFLEDYYFWEYQDLIANNLI